MIAPGAPFPVYSRTGEPLTVLVPGLFVAVNHPRPRLEPWPWVGQWTLLIARVDPFRLRPYPRSLVATGGNVAKSQELSQKRRFFFFSGH